MRCILVILLLEGGHRIGTEWVIRFEMRSGTDCLVEQ